MPNPIALLLVALVLYVSGVLLNIGLLVTIAIIVAIVGAVLFVLGYFGGGRFGR